MDKLKPILAQKFWIMFSLVLIMPLVGYFMTKGKLAAAIEDRWKKLDGAFTGVPDGKGVPNDSWTTRLNDIAAMQKQHNLRANQELWVKQKERMFWPNDIAPIMAKAEYFKDLTQEQNGGQVLFKYPLSYPTQIKALWEIVDPLDEGENLRDSDKRRKVAFAMSDLHLSKILNLGNLRPTFAEIWAAQEDIWLQTELLQAIRRMNANGISQGDAFVKQIGRIQLFGGTKAAGGEGGTAAAGASAAGGADGMAGLMGGGAFGFQGGGESNSLSVDINLSEEFDVVPESTGGGNAAGMAGFSASGFTEAASGAGGADAAKSDGSKRYIDFVETQAYKRRGFYIKVIMDHRKVPDLLAELMNSPFPVEILRVHQFALSDSGNSTEGGSGGFMAGGGGGGFGPGGGPAGVMAGAGGAGGLMSGGAGSGGKGLSLGGFKPPPSGSTAPPASGGAAGFIEDSGAGLGNLGSGSRAGLTGSGSAAAMADPNLAHVAILGVWTLYLPPAPLTETEKAAPSDSATVAPGLAATPENSTSPADSTSEANSTESKPSTPEPSENTNDEAKKPNDSDPPKSESAKPEKAESETDK